MLGVLTIGSDYGWDTIKTPLHAAAGSTRRPRRRSCSRSASCSSPSRSSSWSAAPLRASRRAHRGRGRELRPSAWLLVRTWAAGWFILAVWAALGVLLAVLSRGTALAIGIAIL